MNVQADKNRRTVIVAVLGLLAAWDWNVAGNGRAEDAQAVTMTARVLDLPDVLADGSFRFHVEDESARQDQAVSLPPSKEAAAPLFEDDFDAGRKPQWQDAAGSSHVEDGRLVAASDRNLVVVAGVRQ